MKTWFTTARITGLLYLGLAVSGIVGYLIPVSQLYVPGNATETFNNLVSNPLLTRIGLVGELGIVLFQVLVALWFFRLFKKVNSFVAGTLVVFGLLGAVSILIGLIFSAEAANIALRPISSLGDSQATTAHLLWELHQVAWMIGHLFFGLWLIPMGLLVINAKMPRVLGWILIAGGIGYILSGVLQIAFPQASDSLLEVPTYIASIGEFWIIGYLLLDRKNSKRLV